VDSAVFGPKGKLILVSGERALSRLYSLSTANIYNEKFCNVSAFTPDGLKLLTGHSDGSAILWDIGNLTMSRAERTRIRSFEKHSSRITSLAVSPDGRHAIGGSHETAVLWNMVSGTKRLVLGNRDVEIGEVLCVSFSSDSTRVLIGDANKSATLWDVSTGRRVQTFQGHTAAVRSVALSADGSFAVTGSDDGTARLFNIRDGRRLAVYRHQEPVKSVTFGPGDGFVLTGSLDGTARLWDPTTGQELVRLVNIRPAGGRHAVGPQWLAVTPQGLFDGSRAGREDICFRMRGELTAVPVDRFFRDFYYPGLLAEIWQGKRPMPEKEVGRNPAPEVRMLRRDTAAPGSGQVTIDVGVTNRGGGIQEPWLFHNGLRTGKPEYMLKDGKNLHCTFTVSLVEGENRIQVQSASEDGSWESEPAVVTIDYDGTLPGPELYLLAIGMNEFQRAKPLQGSVSAAKAIAELFENHHVGHYTNVHVTTLFDAEATGDGILKAIDAIAEKAGPQDTLVMYAASHGWTIGQRYYLLPHEYRQAEGQTTNEAVGEWGLPIDELGSRLSQVPALKRVLIFDTCMSGSVAKSQRGLFEFRGAVERFARSQGIFTLAASAGDANAFEHPMTSDMGILTFTLLASVGAIEDKHNLLGGARVEAENPNREVDVLDWFHFAEKHVPRLAEKLAGQKDYQVEMRGREPDFPLLSLQPE